MNRRNFLASALGLYFGGGAAAKTLASVAPLSTAEVTIPGNMIITGTITSAKIAANSLMADKLRVVSAEGLP